MKKKTVKCVLEIQYLYHGGEKVKAEHNDRPMTAAQCAAQQRAIAMIYNILFSKNIEKVLQDEKEAKS